ncbi:MAG: ABC transporter ATP-binding protein [Sulfolobales archaeon]
MIVTIDLTKIYGDGVKALDKVSVETPREGIVALIGANGAGKTTLLKILAGVLKPTSGKVYMRNIDVVKQPERVRELIAFMPQAATPPSFSTPYQFILNYLLYRGFSYKEAKERTLEILEEMGLYQVKDKRSSELSYGMQQRVVASAVLASEAEIVFLDEPTSGLDPVARRTFWASLDSLRRRGRLIVVSSHNPDEIEAISDYVIALSKGRVFAQGRTSDIRSMISFSGAIDIYLSNGSGSRVRELIERYSDKVVYLRNIAVAYFRDYVALEKLSLILIQEGIRSRFRSVSIGDLLILGGEEEEYEENI